jgi:hypothetical protein
MRVPTSLCFLLIAAGSVSQLSARELTFERRLQAQEAIQRVYYSHKIGAEKPFEQAVPREVLEKRVRKHLRQSRALDRIWNTPITAEALHRELLRIALRTRDREMLREIFDALGGDSRLIQECFVRPVLTDRLARNFFAGDPEMHRETRAEAESSRAAWIAAGGAAAPGFPGVESLEVVRADENDAQFARMRGRFPKTVGRIGPVQEERGAFVVHGNRL